MESEIGSKYQWFNMFEFLVLVIFNLVTAQLFESTIKTDCMYTKCQLTSKN